MFPEVNAFTAKRKFRVKTKKQNQLSMPLLNMKKAEVWSCVEGEQKPEYCLGQAVNPLKPEVIHRNSEANSTDPVVKLNFSFTHFSETVPGTGRFSTSS